MLIAYRIANYLLLGPLLVYLWWRGKKDRLYFQHLGERFGLYGKAHKPLERPVWVHAVSLGEMRSAVPLIKALIMSGEQVVTTHFTPVGRREAQKILADEIQQGLVQVLYVPLELHSAYKRFYRAFSPKYGLVMEVEFWPCMIDSAKKHSVPLFLCNGQYPSKSYHRDIKGPGFRASLVSGFTGAMVKSNLQESRFKKLGLYNVAVTGELRFDQPVPDAQIRAANRLLTTLEHQPYIVTIASAVEGEDDLYIDCIKKVRAEVNANSFHPVLFIYVPRAPERFTDVANRIQESGLSVSHRTEVLDDHLTGNTDDIINTDVLLGDSMGEMYFYLQLSELVIVGGGFTAAGAHNISEAFALSKPVLVGPSLWTIEYPAMEAIDAGVLTSVADAQTLSENIIDAVSGRRTISSDQVDDFFTDHQGAIKKTLSAIPVLLQENTTP